MLDTYVESLDNKAFLATGKFNSSTHKHTDIAGVSDVYANDYYYSDIRQEMKKLETTLSINADSAVYKAIQARSIKDLYKLISTTYGSTYVSSDKNLPTNATDMEDAFWLLSRYEADTYFSNDIARQWKNGTMGSSYWLRSSYDANSNVRNLANLVRYDGGSNDVEVNQTYYGARAAFMLRLS